MRAYSSTEGDKLPTYNLSGLPLDDEDEEEDVALLVRRVRESDCMMIVGTMNIENPPNLLVAVIFPGTVVTSTSVSVTSLLPPLSLVTSSKAS
jgi:hypothetical protein